MQEPFEKRWLSFEEIDDLEQLRRKQTKPVPEHGEKEHKDGKFKLRHFVFTWNNWKPGCLEGIRHHEHTRFIVAGREVGESGTPHLQGYCELKQPVSFATIKKLMPGAWMFSRKGTPKQASAYCRKDGEIELDEGEMSHQGERNDIIACTELLKDGKRMRDVAYEYPNTFVKFHRGLKEYQRMMIQPRNDPPEVIVLYGGTGAGKSKRARELCEDPWVWTPLKGAWFDGYIGQKDVIFEEFRGQIPFDHMLVILDRYSCDVQVKGGDTHFSPSRIIFTSPVHPDRWYSQCREDLNQLFRRITTIVEVNAS